ncbi:hypothetical protein FVEN_g4425 [Fusarium venenatum]|uniref:N-acetyltransferase domain-containing protein n=1 Tax=Fusarium venenatum TaxID=56646 RepID=A0A2L2TRC3_9HYPO|nr:uncharacterized protein FVRRES_02688 [Fusarium venenatum]KAG8357680.1 hypothetical protein FVEN_g4425 [Fusarium venenatum]KAH7004227.1 hypothetical protein EDB82DRAFT_44453 [Fusarium venenatum]CEI66176.1 unnamed protein product [Fusarium venenatum]
MGVRIATLEDIPALKEIILKGLSEDSVFKYCFPSTRSETASNHVETVLKRIIDAENVSWLCFVVDAPKTHDPVSLAICQTIHQNADGQKGVAEQAEQVFGLEADDNQTKTIKRLSALQQGITETQQKYLVRHTEVIFLHAVITHPHWIRQGFAKTLSKQTLQVARQKGAVVVALASPFTGYVFYSGTSFANCGRTKVETDNDIENLELQIMVCTPPKPLEQRRSSLMDYLGGATKKMSPAGSRRESYDQDAAGAQEQRRSSFLDMFGFGSKTPNDVDNDARRKSHA